MNITDALTLHAGRTPDADAVLSPDGALSYARLDALVWRAARFLRAAGVAPGDLVAQSYRDERDALVAMLATARIGATGFSLPPGEPALKRAQSAARAGVRHLLVDAPDGALDGMRVVTMRLSDLEGLDGAEDPAVRDPDPHAPWMLATGSGSTGQEKLMPLSHRQMAARMEVTRDLFDAGDVNRLFSLIGIDFAVARNIYTTMLCHGWTVVLVPRDRVDLLATCRRFGVTALVATVMHLERMLAALPPGGAPVLGGLRSLSVGASTVSDALRRRIVERICPNLFVGYGANEVGVVTMARPEHVLAVADTVGVVHPNATVEIVDRDLRPVGPDRVGLVRIRSKGMIEGYHDDPEATRAAFRDGWFYPGDNARMTAEGHLIYAGRADHMMILNGINIYPAEIERALAAHPAVADVAAIPLPSRVHQQVPVGAVTLHPGAQVDAETLQAYARERLGASAPRWVVVLERIPRNPQGKLVRARLLEAVVDALGLRAPQPSEGPQSSAPSAG